MIVRRIAHRIGTDRDVAAPTFPSRRLAPMAPHAGTAHRPAAAYCPGDEAGMERLADGRRAPAAG